MRVQYYAPHHHLPLIVVLFLFCCSAFFHRSSSACLRVERASAHRFQFGCKCLRIDNVWELSNYNWLNRFYHHTQLTFTQFIIKLVSRTHHMLYVQQRILPFQSISITQFCEYKYVSISFCRSRSSFVQMKMCAISKRPIR